jgi:hypothetical protein
MLTETRDQKIARAKRFAATQRTPVLIESLAKIDIQIAEERPRAQRTKDYRQIQALNLTRSWTIEALENRYPEAAEAVTKAFDEATDEELDNLDYDTILLAAIPASEK